MHIRPITKTDITKIARLHRQTLPTTLSSILGEIYLQKIYTTLLEKKTLHIALCAVDGEKMVGVITISKDLLMTQRILTSLAFSGILGMIKMILLGKISPKTVILRIYFERAVTKKFSYPYSTILTLFVDKRYQGRKIATKLLEGGIKILMKEKIKRLYTDTLTNNKKAQDFYKNKGFKKRLKLVDSIVYELSF